MSKEEIEKLKKGIEKLKKECQNIARGSEGEKLFVENVVKIYGSDIGLSLEIFTAFAYLRTKLTIMEDDIQNLRDEIIQLKLRKEN